MEKYPKVAIVYLSFHCEPYLDQLISSLQVLNYPKECLELIIVDNLHPKYGSSYNSIVKKLASVSKENFPHVTLLPQTKNLGFSAGVNIGIRWAIEQNFEYIFLHNQDGYLSKNALVEVVKVMENDTSIGVAQLFMMLSSHKELINNSGNSFHYFGFGYVTHYKKILSQEKFPLIYEIGYASGGAVMLRSSVLQRYGLWDEDYFFYHEDLEYSLRLRSVGLKVVVVRNAIFYHHYEFSRNKDKFYYMERNRLGLLVTYFTWPTLLLFLPGGIFLEISLLFLALKQGWFKEKLKSYIYWLNILTIIKWLKKRKKIQRQRTQKDKYLLKYATDKVEFPEAGINTNLVRYVGNPLSLFYFFIIRRIIFW